MQLAFSTNAFTRHPLSDALTHIASCGYPGVEILIDKPHLYPDPFDPALAEKIRTQLQSLNLRISNLNANCTFGFWSDPPPEPFFEPSLISPDPNLRAARLRLIHNTIDYAHALGAENISITSGKALPTIPPDRAQQLLLENLKPLLDHAHQKNIRIGIECEPMLFIEWASELAHLITAANSPLLGANLDLGHSIVLGEDIPTALALLKGRIWNCHLEDLICRKHYHLIPGQGTVDFAKLQADLAAIHYDRFLTVELYTYPDRPLEAAQQSIAHLRKFFS